jgi:hypothetical protein
MERKIKKFDNFINEEALPRGTWDDSNTKALKTWSDKSPDFEYIITTKEPLSISTTDDVESAKIEMMLYRHNIKFDVEKLKLK